MVLRQHWKQILQIFNKSLIDQDDTTCVINHFQYMVQLLTDEVSVQEQSGPVLIYFISESIFDTFFIWSLSCPEYAHELKYHQLRFFEYLLSRSRHELLFHKQIFKPLLNLLRSCESSSCIDLIEKHMIVVLNQVCVSITKSTPLLELCFDISAEQGPARFIIFSLLIPFVHRAELTGQQARDALLLIMQLSSRNEHIAKYIVENTNFCPILATGLSALYSDLPHRLPFYNDDWYHLTKKEWSETASLVQFMNSLQFCNDVIQIAHPSIGHHLIQYVYHGFLVPVLGPAIHQEIHAMPAKFLELQQFSNTMDEVVAATAYLDLFLRTVNEPALLKVFLRFILCARIDEINLLDTLIQRINNNTKLGVVSLGLFHTLINLNCEDVMYRLIFMYLIPCRHVMCSQKRYIGDMEIYGKNVERFLSLRPSFLNKNNLVDSTQNEQSKQQQRVCFDDTSHERYECTFSAYLEDAHFEILRCRIACRQWSAPYDGENPSSESVIGDSDLISLASSISSLIDNNNQISSNKKLSKLGDGLIKPTTMMGKNVASSNDSGIHEDGLDTYSQNDVQVSPSLAIDNDQNVTDGIMKQNETVIKNEFQLPSWLANGEPVPDDLLKKYVHKNSEHSYHQNHQKQHIYDTEENEDDDEYYNNYYSFSYVGDLSNSDDTSSTKSSIAPSNIYLSDSIRTCVDTLNGCLNTFVTMNEHFSSSINNFSESKILSDELSESVDENIIRTLLNELLDTVTELNITNEVIVNDHIIEQEKDISIEKLSTLTLDTSLLSEICSKATNPYSLNDFLTVLDQSIDLNGSSHFISSKALQYAEEIVRDILQLSDEIEKQKILNGNVTYKQQENGDQLLFPTDTNEGTNPFISTTQSSYSMYSLQQSVSMDLSQMINDNNNQTTANNTSAIATSTIQTQQQIGNGKLSDVGPFLRTIFIKLENMLQNSLYVNLLLTGIIARLAYYSQPLLRSLLLNHSLVLETNVKSLFQILSNLKSKLESTSQTFNDFSYLVEQAQDCLYKREATAKEYEDLQRRTRSPSRTRSKSVDPSKERGSRRNRILDFFRRGRPNERSGSKPSLDQSHVTLVNKASIKFINIRDGILTSAALPSNILNEWDDPKTRNVAYCAVIFNEFLKELAAITQEHAVQQFDDTSFYFTF
ncbi:unnamed protein product [Didymodactylos carnosus]|uniref:FHF complex subunit HOOK-interacting protein C-terminal domain-containing protein n=4 Tax=Didymodactylos carnosus TaxID=1234261 RepID=A0A813R1N2_9BILA|nr:unnamed protein product [Didymodactylos carnosus]CAF3556478.1 unnamed protein product [Didymodactylos carnosus]